MDLFYGNDGNNYRIFAQSAGLSSKAVQMLQKSYMQYFFPKNASAYSSVSKEPESICYVTSNLNREMPSEMVVLCKNGHMTRYSTPSFFFHAHLMEIPSDFYKDAFFDIFSLQFVDDTEINQYDNVSIEAYQIGTHVDIREDALTDDQLKVVLYWFFYNERLGQPVRILLDQGGDEYNRRSREVLKAIYRHLPYQFRKKYGFLSYCDEMQSCPSRVSFVLYDRTQVRKPGDLEVDLANADAAAARNMIGMRSITDYVDYLVGLSSDARTKHFDALDRMSEGGRLSVQDCLDFVSLTQKWEEKDTRVLLPEWIDYVYKNVVRPTAMYQTVILMVKERVSDEQYNEYLFVQLDSQSGGVREVLLARKKELLFADYIGSLHLDQDRMIEWIDRKLPYPVTGSNLEKIKALEEDISYLKEIDVGSGQMAAILLSAVENREITVREYEEAERKLIQEEKDQVQEQIDTINHSPKANQNILICSRHFRQLLDKVNYAENRQPVLNAVCELLEGMLRFLTQADPPKQKNIEDMEGALSLFKEEASIQPYVEQYQQLQEEWQRIAAQKLDTNVLITDRQSLIDGIRKIDRLREALKAYPPEYQKPVILSAGMSRLELALDEAECVLEFFLAPQIDNAEETLKLLLTVSETEADSFLCEMLQKRILTLEHYEHFTQMEKLLFDPRVLDGYFINLVPEALTWTGEEREKTAPISRNLFRSAGAEDTDAYEEDDEETWGQEEAGKTSRSSLEDDLSVKDKTKKNTHFMSKLFG
ncbi:MAG: hypothetical protein LUI87_14440, partial [Lachnospiraceae bacterium]|nr:hypothetical protein [Lachnospiraceae bacterium]